MILPGMDGTGLLLEPFIAALGADVSVKVVRYPTTEPLGYSGLEGLARTALPQQGPFVILGESFSGPLAVSLASTCSPQLKGVILCASFVRNPRPGLAWLRPFISMLPVVSAPLAMLSYLLLGRHASGAMRSALAQALARLAASALRARLRAVLEVDVTRQLAALNVPVLYLRAARDRVVPRAASEIVLQTNPRAALIEIEAPHFLLQAAPAEAAIAIGNFLLEVQDGQR